MPRKTLNYSEGTLFVLPLRDGGAARGVVARMDGKGCVLGYFFGPRLTDMSGTAVHAQPTAEAAVYCRIFGDLGLLRGAWPILGRIDNWQREEWPMPPFVYRDDGSGQCYLRYYDENDLSFLREEPTSTDAAAHYPRDGCAGYGAVEIRLTSILGG